MSRRKGHDPVAAFRAPGPLVAEARRIAASRGETIGDVLRAALRAYVKRHGSEKAS